MDTVTVHLGALDAEADALDLENSLNAVNGVASVEIDRGTRMAKIKYDPRFASADSIENAVKGSGYPEPTQPPE